MNSTKKISNMSKISFVILFAMFFSVFFVFAFAPAVTAAEGDKPNPSGAYLKYTVDVSKKGDERLAYNFMTIRKLDYVIQEGDVLEYDVYITLDERGWGAVDGEISVVGTIRDSGMSDTENNGIHTGVDLSGEAFEQWYHRVIPFGITEDDNAEKYTVGRTLKLFQLAMHPEADENEYQGVALYDNIVITNNGEVKLVIFRDAEDFAESEVKLSHQSGAKGTVELLVFTEDEEREFKEAEERAIKEQESREAAKIEAESQRAASIEQASIEASSIEALKQEEDAAKNTDPINEPTGNSGSDSDSEANGAVSLVLIIAVAVGVAALIVIIIVIVMTGKKKNKE